MTDAAERSRAGDPLIDVWIVASHAVGEVGRDGAWSDRVYADFPAAKFGRQVAGQNLNRTFVRRVRAETRRDCVRRARRNIENATAVGDHRQQRLSEE
jgi:hypothetical protein